MQVEVRQVVRQHGSLLLADHLERLHLDLLQPAAFARRLVMTLASSRTRLMFTVAMLPTAATSADISRKPPVIFLPMVQWRNDALHCLLPPLEAGRRPA